jgi:uncharacterized protein YjdB
MSKKYLGIVAGMLLLAGCSNNDFTDNRNFTDTSNNNKVQQAEPTSITTVQATIGDAVDTRAIVMNDATAGNKSVAWSEGDEILVLSDLQHDPIPYGMIDLEDNVATFCGDAVAGEEKFYALYPAWGWIIDGSSPAIAHFEEWRESASENNEFWFGSPMVAISDGNDVFSFKQTMGLIHIAIGNIYSIEGVHLYGNNGEILNGPGYVDLSEDNPVFRIDETAEMYDTSIYGYASGVTDGETKNFYFAVPPTTFEKGFRIVINGTDEDGHEIELTKSTSAKIVVDRAQVRNFALVDVNESLVDQEAKSRAALMALYDALDGNSWVNKTNWGDPDKPLSDWYGVFAPGNIVKEISLTYNGLAGEVPAAIGDIATLESLNLGGNAITAVPAELSKLRNLSTLGLNENQLTTFPEAILEMPGLYNLSLAYNQISGNLPEGLSNLTGLGQLQLQGNNFEGTIPDSYFENLNNLYEFNLEGNRLEGMVTIAQWHTAMWQNCDYKSVTHQQEGYGVTIEGAVTEIQLDKYRVVIPIGQTVQLTATVWPQDAYDKQVIWEMYWMTHDGDNAPFTVDENGLVTALHEGEGEIIVRAADRNGAEAYCSVRVVKEQTEGEAEGFTGSNHDWTY